MVKQKNTQKVKREPLTTNQRLQNAGLAIVSLGLGYIVASRAIDTGSWWEYGGTVALLIFTINRVVRIFWGAPQET